MLKFYNNDLLDTVKGFSNEEIFEMLEDSSLEYNIIFNDEDGLYNNKIKTIKKSKEFADVLVNELLSRV